MRWLFLFPTINSIGTRICHIVHNGRQLGLVRLLTIKFYRMSKFGLEYKEETGFDVGVHCENFEDEGSVWYYQDHYVEWLEQKIEAFSQVAVIKSVCQCKPPHTYANDKTKCWNCGKDIMQTVL